MKRQPSRIRKRKKQAKFHFSLAELRKHRIKLLILVVILIATMLGGYAYHSRLASPTELHLPVGYWQGTVQSTDVATLVRIGNNSSQPAWSKSIEWFLTLGIGTRWLSVQPGLSGLTRYYGPIDLETRNISAASPYMIDPQRLYQGNTVKIVINDWAMCAQGVWALGYAGMMGFCSSEIVPFVVGGSQNVMINGSNVEAWRLSYVDSSKPSLYHPICYSGPPQLCVSWRNVTHTYFYDKAYGLLVGWMKTETYTFFPAGNIRSLLETISSSFQTYNTNIPFPNPNIFSQLTQPTFLILISVLERRPIQSHIIPIT
jgi:hypothetical protein